MTHLRRHRLSVAIASAIAVGLPAAAGAGGADVRLPEIGANEPGYQVQGGRDSGELGFSLSGIGDFDGDGFADAAFGEPDFSYQPPPGPGKVYVIIGEKDGVIDSASLPARSIEIVGEGLGFRTGKSVSGAGDVNGDGFDDLIVGAPDAIPGYAPVRAKGQRNYAGKAYVIFGSEAPSSVTLPSASGGFDILGTRSYQSIGRSVSGAGDVNGDGFEDVIIGAGSYYGYDLSYGPFAEAEAFVVFGQPAPAASSDAGAPGAGFRISAFGAPSLVPDIGYSVSGAGDVNGDGFDDVLVSSYNSEGSGPIFVVFGSKAPTDVTLPPLPGEGFTIATPFGRRSAGTAGDVNGDGFDDVVVGMPYQSPRGGIDTGAAYVILGSSTPQDVNVVSLAPPAGFTVAGGDYERLGTAVAGAGDVDGDGLADLLLGAPDNFFTEPGGLTYLLFGKPVAEDALLGPSTGERVVTFGGDASFGSDAGLSLSAAGDVDGDGLGDAMIGDPRLASASAFAAGGGYVLLSQATPPALSTYRNFAPPDDAPLRAVGVLGDRSNASFPNSRFWIGFDDGTGTGAEGASEQRVTLYRDTSTLDLSSVGDDVEILDVYWQADTDRGNWTGGAIQLRYVDSELATLATDLGEIDFTTLNVYRADDPAGPWQRLRTQVDPVRRLIQADVAGELGILAVASVEENTIETGAEEQDRFGQAVAACGNLVYVGVPNGGDDNNGEVRVYRIEGNDQILDDVLTVPPGFTAENFGAALSCDGDRILIGAPSDGVLPKGPGVQALQAAIWQRTNGVWSQKQPLSSGAGGDDFGMSVQLSGNMVVVGAPGDDEGGADSGAAYVYMVDGNNAVTGAPDKLTPPPGVGGPGTQFGMSVAASAGNVAVGMPGATVNSAVTGAVGLYALIAGNLQGQGTVTGTDSTQGAAFGSSVSLQGTMMAVGAPGQQSGGVNGAGQAYTFSVGGGNAVQNSIVTPAAPQAGGGFGSAVSMGAGNLAVGSPGTGNVFVYAQNLALLQTVSAAAGDSEFGSAISFDGQNLLIGAPGTSNERGTASLQRDPGLISRIAFE